MYFFVTNGDLEKYGKIWVYSSVVRNTSWNILEFLMSLLARKKSLNLGLTSFIDWIFLSCWRFFSAKWRVETIWKNYSVLVCTQKDLSNYCNFFRYSSSEKKIRNWSQRSIVRFLESRDNEFSAWFLGIGKIFKKSSVFGTKQTSYTNYRRMFKSIFFCYF